MYIQSPTVGAFSVVLADDPSTGLPDSNTVMVRARVRGHLALLQRASRHLKGTEILLSKPGADYPYRLVASKQAIASALADLVTAVDYRNVKAAAGANRGAVGGRYASALHGVHSRLRDIQEPEETA